MIHRDSTRRRFLVAAIGFSGLISTGMGPALLRAGSAWAQSTDGMDDGSAAALAGIARRLFPHDGVADAVYVEVMDAILADAAGDTALAGAIQEALEALGADWPEATVERQVEVMQTLQAESFFTAIQAAVRNRVYTHEAVWEHIAYPGSSVEHGGYVDRGFDDIDWLPEEA